MSLTKTICFANNKGGSGKSTTCANVGYAMSILGKKVLLIDGDMQMNLTLSFFDDEKSLEFAKSAKNLYSAIIDQKDLDEYVIHTGYDNLDIIPSSTLMSSIEFQLFTKWQREYILKRGLQKVKESGNYDYILIFELLYHIYFLLRNFLLNYSQIIFLHQILHVQYFCH